MSNSAGMASGADRKLFADATQVVLMREGTRTVRSMQNDYEGPPAAFAMAVPVPVVLAKGNVKSLPRDVFDKTDPLGSPRLVEYRARAIPRAVLNTRERSLRQRSSAGNAKASGRASTSPARRS